MMIFLNLVQIFFASLLMAQSPYTNVSVDKLALENREDGSVRYVVIAGNQENNRAADPENSIIAVSYRHYSNPNSGNLISGLAYGAHADQITMPINSTSVTVNGQTTNLERGALILATDGEIYLIENIYPDGRLAVYRSTVNANSRNRVHDNFVPLVRENTSVIHVDDIQATQTDCFFGYCKNDIHADIQGVPICDQEVLVAYIEGWGMKDTPRMSCRMDGARIQGVFNDGTLVSGKTVFNPFPESLKNYQVVEANTETEGNIAL